MSGPLSRLRSSLDILESGDDIPWTYISPEAEHVDDDAVTYTSLGVSNKRRKTYKKKKDKIDVKPASEPNSLDWTEEEEYSLCQVVAISLQKSSGNKNDSLATEVKAGPSSSENDQTEALQSKNITKELKTMTISKILAGCFIPTHGYTDIVTRVKSGTFRRKFIYFLECKTKQSKGLVTQLNCEATEGVSCDEQSNTINSRDRLQDGTQQELKKKASKPTKGLSVRSTQKTKQKHQKHSQVEESSQSEIALNEINPAERDVKTECDGSSVREIVHECLQQEKSRSVVKKSEQCQPTTKRSSPRLKNKQTHNVSDADDDMSMATNISTDLPDDIQESMKQLENRDPIRTKSINANRNEKQKQTQECQTSKQQGNPGNPDIPDIPDMLSSTQTSSDPAEANLSTNQRRKRNMKTVVQLVKQESVTEVLPTLDNKDGNLRTEVELNRVAKPSKKRNGCNQEVAETMTSHVPESESVSLLAVIQPLIRDPKPNVKANDKRRFKNFRKKLLDKSLEVQQSGVTLTSTFRLPHISAGGNTKGCDDLDKYLTMQQVQQSRKNILDACLMVQRDST